MASVHVCVGHQNDFAVTHFRGIEIFLGDAGAERGDHGANFLVRQHLVVARFFYVQDFALQGKDRLETAVAALLRGPAGGLAFDQKQFAAVGIAFGTVRQLARQATGIKRTFAPRQIARLPCGLAGARGIDCLIDDLSPYGRVLFEERAQSFVDELRDRAGDVGVQLALGLAFELRLGQLHADDRDQTFTHVVAGQIFFYVFKQAHLLPGIIDGAGQRGAESREMRAAVDGVDVVGETEHRFGICVVVLESNLHVDAVAVVFHVDRLVVQHLFAAIEMLDELSDAAVVFEVGVLGLAGLRIRIPLVGQRDQQSLVQKCEFAQSLRQRVVVVLRLGKNRPVGQEVNSGPGLHFGDTGLVQLVGGIALGIILLPGCSVAPDLQLQIFAQRVHAGNADAVQSAGDFVSRRIKFSTRVQRGHHHLRRGNFLAVNHHVVNRNAASVVNDRDRIVEMDGDFNLGGETSKSFVDGIVDHFVNEMMQPEFARRSDVHRRTFANRFHAAQHFDGVGVVVAVAAVASAVRGSDWSYDPVFCFGVCDGSMISLVAIPLHENVPNVAIKTELRVSKNGLEICPDRALFSTLYKDFKLLKFLILRVMLRLLKLYHKMAFLAAQKALNRLSNRPISKLGKRASAGRALALRYFFEPYFFNPAAKLVTTVMDWLTCCATRFNRIFFPSGLTS